MTKSVYRFAVFFAKFNFRFIVAVEYNILVCPCLDYLISTSCCHNVSESDNNDSLSHNSGPTLLSGSQSDK